MEPKYFIRAAIALSVVGHLALTLGFLLADAHLFEPVTSDAIAIDIVAPEDIPSPAKQTPPTPPPKPDDPFRLPELTSVDRTPQQAQQQRDLQPQAPQPAPAPSQEQARSQGAGAQPPASPQASRPPLQPQAQTQTSQAEPAAPEPDITVKYGVMFGLPSGDGGATAFAKADIAPIDTAAFRRHLKTCSGLPGSVAPTDKVRIVLRVFLEPTGRLVGAPGLIEASASAKGPALMQAAINALQACQPYAMLPAAKYDEWKVLDLSFTPQDFGG